MKFNTFEQSFDAFDEAINPPPEVTEFDSVVEEALSRRDFLSGLVSFGAGSFVVGASALNPEVAKAQRSRFDFMQVAANSLDTVTVPEGYSSQIVVRWGDPMYSNVPEFDHVTRGTADSQARSYGDNIDGMALFELGDANVLVNNNEYTNRKIIWGNRAGGQAETDDDVLKGMMAHGISIIEVTKRPEGWVMVKDSKYNRRITPETQMEITGPASGHRWMRTAEDPTGTICLGTWNNCGSGRTPWGTYLACEENFNGYYSSSDTNIERTDGQKRYGIPVDDWGYGWSRVDDRFDIAKHPNEANRNGWVVEIDPADPASTPKKRTALGRFKHENAEVVVNGDGRVVVYMGDDERGEFLYRFVSAGVFVDGADNSDLLAEGSLFAAKFHPDGTGRWLALTSKTTGMASQAEIVIHARLAASKVGATTMDRPEWVAANPNKAEVYCALTNNRNRAIKPNVGGDPTPATGPNPRAENQYGQIVRWWPAGGDHVSDTFNWDLFVLAGNPAVHSDSYGGSVNVNDGNMFNSPDGLFFDARGLLWIQTDGNYSDEGDFAGHGNNQMLVGDPDTGEIKRFLVGPNECEVTGAAMSSDGRTLFVGIQHPGEHGNSHWPEGGESVPRSAVIAVTRNDGSPIG
ncbi:PhoX family phosphatase [Labrenzia sp. DG1229]|uniref:PhoX family protein n=1 Tax=Labrenzia sp. DG1229 TaxID=681847 RepID=UPI00048D42B7|nr:PhoX family phosphatase [Labrenzia sp. DG1229]